MEPYTIGAHRKRAFVCPFCKVLSAHDWATFRKEGDCTSFDPVSRTITFRLATIEAAECLSCGRSSIWIRDKMISPITGSAPLPNPDMPEDIQSDYREANDIAVRSPRGAATLLRLAIQKLCKHLGEKGKNLDDDIASLVKKGLPVETQQELDIVRVIGNNAVHPGERDLRNDQETALALFELVNSIVEDMITRPKKRQELYTKLPKGALDGIAKRNAKATKAPAGA
jgi:hypothetical protein